MAAQLEEYRGIKASSQWLQYVRRIIYPVISLSDLYARCWFSFNIGVMSDDEVKDLFQ